MHKYKCFLFDGIYRGGAYLFLGSKHIASYGKSATLTNFEIRCDAICGRLRASLHNPKTCVLPWFHILHMRVMVTRLKYAMKSHLISRLDRVYAHNDTACVHEHRPTWQTEKNKIILNYHIFVNLHPEQNISCPIIDHKKHLAYRYPWHISLSYLMDCFVWKQFAGITFLWNIFQTCLPLNCCVKFYQFSKSESVA